MSGLVTVFFRPTALTDICPSTPGFFDVRPFAKLVTAPYAYAGAVTAVAAGATGAAGDHAYGAPYGQSHLSFFFFFAGAGLTGYCIGHGIFLYVVLQLFPPLAAMGDFY